MKRDHYKDSKLFSLSLGHLSQHPPRRDRLCFIPPPKTPRKTRRIFGPSEVVKRTEISRSDHSNLNNLRLLRDVYTTGTVTHLTSSFARRHVVISQAFFFQEILHRKLDHSFLMLYKPLLEQILQEGVVRTLLEVQGPAVGHLLTGSKRFQNDLKAVSPRRICGQGRRNAFAERLHRRRLFHLHDLPEPLNRGEHQCYIDYIDL